MIAGIRAWMRQPDVKAHPLRALWRRFHWRWHWRSSNQNPILVKRWYRNIGIYLVKSGSSAVAFYRDFKDDPIVKAMDVGLAPGMRVFDIGAHVGAYSLIAAQVVGNEGMVIALEPQPDLACLIRRNADLNAFQCVSVVQAAVGAAMGQTSFSSDIHTKGGWKSEAEREKETFSVQVQTLDDISRVNGRADFIKLDAAGFEAEVIKGGSETLSRIGTPHLAIKFYHPTVVLERSGSSDFDLGKELNDVGYTLLELSKGRWIRYAGHSEDYCVVVVATLQPDLFF